MTVTCIEKLKENIEANVCAKIEMQTMIDDEEKLFVHPRCYVGAIPQSSVTEKNKPKSETYTIPAICIGVDEVVDGKEEAEISITLGFAVYMQSENENSNNGYIELLNLIDKTKAFLLRDSFNLGYMIIKNDVKTTIPPASEQAEPYWFGYIKFVATSQAYPNYDAEKYGNML